MNEPSRPSPLSTNVPWNLVAEGYQTDTMPMLAPYSHDAIAAVEPSPNARVLDVACGPGTLSLLIAKRVARVDAVDFSEQMIAIVERRKAEHGADNVFAHHMDGQALEFEEAQFDLGFSMFGLMFFPDRAKGFRELHRVLKPGGKVAITSWSFIERSPAMMAMFGALRAAIPDLPAPEKSIDTLEHPEVFERSLHDAGFRDIDIRPVVHTIPIASIDAAWESMVRGSAPIALMRTRYNDEQWLEKSRIAKDYLSKAIPTVPTELASEALLATARKPTSAPTAR